MVYCYNVDCSNLSPANRCSHCDLEKNRICEDCFSFGLHSQFVPYQKCCVCFSRCCLYCLTTMFNVKFKFCPQCKYTIDASRSI